MHCHCGTNNRAPRWTFSNLKHIHDIKHITHTPFQIIIILTRRSNENQATVFEHVKQNTCTCISQNVSFYRKVALCSYTWLQ